ncbi:RNA-binding domain-containing protein [Syncephalis fuscata]|nr:RNA-binding domain-containing protein [Syncephalis fuscata]
MDSSSASIASHAPVAATMLHADGAAIPEESANPTSTADPATLGTPNHTLYIKNLNERVKLSALKTSLETLFERYGALHEVHVKKYVRMRGQAFIVFKELDSATKALKEVQGFPLYNKPMVIAYARNRSDTVAKLQDNYDTYKREREEEKARRAQEQPRKKQTLQNRDSTQGGYANASGIQDEFLPPNQILYIQKLPVDITEDTLVNLFQQYPGYKEVRLVPTRPDIAFVEYETEDEAAEAKEALHRYQIKEGHPIRVTFARK